MTKSFSLKIMLLGVAFIVLLFYLPTLRAFFQQDEWIAFGNAYANENFTQLVLQAIKPNVGHYVPLHYLYFDLMFRFVGINFQAWMISSIFWHLAITYLVGILLSRFLNNKTYAILGALLFGLSGTANQATTWAVADINTHGSAFFGFLSLLYFDKYLEKDKKKTYLVISLISCLISLLFKEVTVALFVTVPLIYFLRKKTIKMSEFIRSNYLWWLFGFLYLLFRLVFVFFTGGNSADLATKTQSIKLITYNIISSPSKVFFQSLMPSSAWLALSRRLGSMVSFLTGIEPKNFAFDHFVESRLLELIMMSLFSAVVLVVLSKIRNLKNHYVRVLYFAFAFIVLNSFIYALSPGRSGLISLIDGRNLYFCLFGSLLFVFSGYELYAKKYKKFLNIIFVLLLVLNLSILFREIRSQVVVGQLRRSVLAQIDKNFVPIPKKIVVYVSSDSSYYGLPPETTIPPFQSGFGQTLLVWFSASRHYPKEFYQNYYLWPIDSQGYKEMDGYAFGYYRDYAALLSAVKEYSIPIDSVYSLSWENKPEAISNITNDIQTKLSNDVQEIK